MPAIDAAEGWVLPVDAGQGTWARRRQDAHAPTDQLTGKMPVPLWLGTSGGTPLPLFASFVGGLEGQRRDGAAEEVGHQVDHELVQILKTHEIDSEADRRVEGAPGDSAH